MSKTFTNTNMTEVTENETIKNLAFRESVARWVVTFSLWALGILGLAAIVAGTVAGYSDGDKLFTFVKDVLSIILPMIGVWVGTVLAFYFSRENFEAATRSTAALVKQLTPEEKLKSVSVKDAMIAIETATKLILDKTEDQIKLKVDVIDALLEKEIKRSRLPILDKTGIIKYIAHRSLIDAFIAKSLATGKKLEDLTLKNLLDDTESKRIMESFKTLSVTATLADAKILVDKDKNCADIFITEDGTPKTKVVGWVTDVKIREQSTV